MIRGGGPGDGSGLIRNLALVPYALILGLLGAAGASAAPSYPVVARLRMAPKDQQHCPTFGGEADCGVLDAVQAAFGTIVSRMFKAGAAPDIDLVVQVRNAEISRTLGKQLELTTRVRVLTPAGEVIDEIDAAANALLLAEEKGSLANAARNAADDVAGIFEREYANDSKVGDYLVSRKIGPAVAVGFRERGDRLLTVSAGMGFVQGGGDEGFAVAPSLRIAYSWRRFFLQGSYSHYTSSFQGVNGSTAIPAESDLTTNDLGFEAGGVYRFTPSIELRGGPGMHFLFGDGTQGSASQSFSKAAPSLFASISTSFLVSHNAPRFVLGAEGRAYFFSTVDVPQLLRRVPAANTYFAVLLGIELPWGSKSEVHR